MIRRGEREGVYEGAIKSDRGKTSEREGAMTSDEREETRESNEEEGHEDERKTVKDGSIASYRQAERRR